MSETLKQFIDAKIESDKLSLVSIGGGAAVEMFDRQLDRVMQNIADENTDAKPRTITLQVQVVPKDEHRSIVGFNIHVPPAKLSGQEPITGTADVGIDASGKGAYAKKRKEPQLGLPGGLGNVHKIERRE